MNITLVSQDDFAESTTYLFLGKREKGKKGRRMITLWSFLKSTQRHEEGK